MGIFAKAAPKAAVSSDTLADRIGKLEAELNEHALALDAAEAAMVNAAGDDVAYAAASAEAGRIRSDVAGRESILSKMREAHAAAIAAERDDLLSRLAAKREKLLAEKVDGTAKLREDREQEERRHADAVKALDARSDELLAWTATIDNEIKLANAGIRESAINEITRLRARRKQVASQIPDRSRDAHTQALHELERARFAHEYCQSTSPQSVVESAEKKFTAADAEWRKFKPLIDELKQLDKAIQTLGG